MILHFFKSWVGSKLFVPVVIAAVTPFLAASFSRDRFIKVYFPDRFSVTAELAVTDEERQQGLMFREKLKPHQGMLFIFEEEDVHSFWMKNMKFSIDILWLDRGKKIVHIERQVPPCPEEPCPSYGPRVQAKYVLELLSGCAEAHGLKLNDRLVFVLPKDLPAEQ